MYNGKDRICEICGKKIKPMSRIFFKERYYCNIGCLEKRPRDAVSHEKFEGLLGFQLQELS